MAHPEVQRWAAFTRSPDGGNPAGVVLDADGMDDESMHRIARDVGYAETAFVSGRGRRRGIRYFSPVAEVPFCGHATVASAVALAERLGDGMLEFATPAGDVRITTARRDGLGSAAFTSVEPWSMPLGDGPRDLILDLLGLRESDLDPDLPAHLAFAGNPHPLLVVRDEGAFDAFEFDPARARRLMEENRWPATIIVLRRTEGRDWEARNVFPVGTLTEDPATGAAAAATGAYLRAIGAVRPPLTFDIAQGRHVGRPGTLRVTVPEAGGITVSGTAVRIA